MTTTSVSKIFFMRFNWLDGGTLSEEDGKLNVVNGLIRFPQNFWHKYYNRKDLEIYNDYP